MEAKKCHFNMGYEQTYGPKLASTPIIGSK
jgi:hypothetical protein